MADKIIGKMPEFTSEETPTEETGQEEEKKAPTEEVEEKEKETPSEPPAEEKPAEEPEGKPEGEGDDAERLQYQIEQLKKERETILQDIVKFRGERREVKQQQLEKVEEQIDDLKDTHPDDIRLIERVLKAKGYVRKEDVTKEIYSQVKQQELDSFLNKHPEYKPENDEKDMNWVRLQKELEFYRMPTDPKKIGEVLERAHKSIGGGFSGGQDIAAKKHRAQVAGAGGAGVKSPSSGGGTLSPEQRQAYKDGGWSEEEIRKIEQKIT